MIEIPDVSQADITPFFAASTHFIDTALSGQRGGGAGSVLVHCRAGVSRSTSLVLHFMMARKMPDWTARVNLGSAFATVKARRSIVGPNGGFRRQLVAAEFAIFGSNSVGISLKSGSNSSGTDGGSGRGGPASISKWKRKRNKKTARGSGCAVC